MMVAQELVAVSTPRSSATVGRMMDTMLPSKPSMKVAAATTASISIVFFLSSSLVSIPLGQVYFHPSYRY